MPIADLAQRWKKPLKEVANLLINNQFDFKFSVDRGFYVHSDNATKVEYVAYASGNNSTWTKEYLTQSTANPLVNISYLEDEESFLVWGRLEQLKDNFDSVDESGNVRKSTEFDDIAFISNSFQSDTGNSITKRAANEVFVNGELLQFFEQSIGVYDHGINLDEFHEFNGKVYFTPKTNPDLISPAPTFEELYPSFPISGNDSNIYIRPILEKFISEHGERPKPRVLWSMILEDEAINKEFTIDGEKENALIRGFNGKDRFAKNNSDDNHRNWQKRK